MVRFLTFVSHPCPRQLDLPQCFTVIDAEYRFPTSSITVKEKSSGVTLTVGLKRPRFDGRFCLCGEPWVKLCGRLVLEFGYFLFFEPKSAADQPFLELTVFRHLSFDRMNSPPNDSMSMGSFFVYFVDPFSPHLLLPKCFFQIDAELSFPSESIIIKEKILGKSWTVGLKRPLSNGCFRLCGDTWIQLTGMLGFERGHHLFFEAKRWKDEPYLELSVYRNDQLEVGVLLAGGEEEEEEEEEVDGIHEVDHHLSFTVTATNSLRLPVHVAYKVFGEDAFTLTVRHGEKVMVWVFEKLDPLWDHTRFGGLYLVGWHDIMYENGIEYGDLCKLHYIQREGVYRMLVEKRSGVLI